MAAAGDHNGVERPRTSTVLSRHVVAFGYVGFHAEVLDDPGRHLRLRRDHLRERELPAEPVILHLAVVLAHGKVAQVLHLLVRFHVPDLRPLATTSPKMERSMATKAAAAAILFLSFNLMFFTLTGACGTGCFTTKPTPTPSGKGRCPIDALKLSACANVLNGLINVEVGKFPKQPCDCCTVIDGLLDLEAAVCLCTAIKGNVLGINPSTR